MPLTRMAPLVGASRSAIARSSVVLPQPDGPIKETNSPRSTARSMPLSACTGPSAVTKLNDKPATSMTRAPTAVSSVVASGLSILSRDAFRRSMLLPCGERPGLGRERLTLDEIAAAGFDLNLAVAPGHFAARQG